MKQIIAVCGFIGSGKSTITDYLISNHNYITFGFADSLKHVISDVFGWPVEMLMGHTVESRIWREQVDEWWSKRLNMPGLTPRKVLQNWGTDLFRNTFHDEIWIASVERKLNTIDGNIIISDCRFPNEATALKKLNAKLIEVYKLPLLEWYYVALNDLKYNRNLMPIYYPNIHNSEWAWLNLDFDARFNNNKTKQDLYNQIDQWLQNNMV